MQANNLFVSSAILFAVATVVIAAGPSSSPNSPFASSAPAQRQSPEAPPPQQAPKPGSVLQIKTRLVTVDVVATDSHGNVVRDLKPEEFEVSDGETQEIAQFSFVEKSTNSGAAKLSNAVQMRPKGFYTNQAELERLTTPPTVILLDALNTEGANLMQARRDMVRMLRTLPLNTPVAVFLLEQSLVAVQDLSSDPAVLRAALDRTRTPGTKPIAMPKKDPNGPALTKVDVDGGIESSVLAKTTQSLEDFEKANHTRTMDIRVATTLDTLTALAHYLGGYRGRKNLIWVSASFPIVLLPDLDFGKDTNVPGETRVYGEKVQDATNALTDAQVAVYAVDARGLESEAPFSAAESGAPRSPNTISQHRLGTARPRGLCSRDEARHCQRESKKDQGITVTK
jgi:VWFA-related protein